MESDPALAAAASPRRGRGHLGHARIAVSARELSSAGGHPALNRVGVDIVAGQITVIYGTPGSGKTALLRLLAGLDRPRAGTVWIGERRIEAAPGRPSLRLRRDELAFLGAERHDGRARTRRAEIFRALAPNPKLVYIDEPGRGLNRSDLDRVHTALDALTAIRGRTAVVVTSDPEVACWGQRLLGLDGGRLVVDLDSPTPAEARGVVGELLSAG